MAFDLGLLSLGDRLPDPITGALPTAAARHRSIVESAVRAEAIGLSSVWLGEHHLCDYVLSSPPVVLAAIGERTRSLRLGTGVTLLATLDPLRVAEDYATLDGLSDGRAEIVVGRGILARTYADFGQDFARSRDAFTEKLELLLRLWSERDVVWKGQHRAPLDGVTSEPRPVQTAAPVWVGGGSSTESVDLAARLGLPLMLPSVLGPPRAFVPLVERYRERFEPRAGGAGPRVGACSHVHVAPTSQGAREGWRPYYLNYWSFVMGLLEWGGAAVGRAAANGVDYDAMLRGPAICGSPAEVADRILGMRDLLGLDVHLSMFDLGGLPEAALLRTLDLFGRDVVPEIRRAASSS
jgi:alkanesulfonate monooxygenase SsuD/methylene tetrahydromethanopterin reductase-like flavin-dependent oxidoreductase (luciferase family)